MRQTENTGLIVGKLIEKNLEVIDGTYYDNNGNKQPCDTIRGSLTVRTDNGLFALRVWANSKKKNGDDAPMYKGYETVMESYVSEADVAKGNGQIADNISCTISLNNNDYVGRNGNIVSTIQLRPIFFNRVDADTESTANGALEGYVKAIRPEIINDNETGRKIVDFIGIGYNDVAEPFALILPEDIADDFEDMYEIGNTCNLYVNIVMRHVGNNDNKKSAAFGRKAQLRSGFDIMEIQIMGGDNPYDDEEDENGNTLAFNAKEIKNILEERDVALEAKLNEANSGKNKKNKNIGKKANAGAEPIDDDIPF